MIVFHSEKKMPEADRDEFEEDLREDDAEDYLPWDEGRAGE